MKINSSQANSVQSWDGGGRGQGQKTLGDHVGGEAGFRVCDVLA